MNKYEQMSDFEINRAVTKICCPDSYEVKDGYVSVIREGTGGFYNLITYHCEVDYCNNPSDAFPIILKNEIAISPYSLSEDSPNCEEYKDMWCAMKDKDWYVDDKNPLRAAMIIFLMMKESEKESVEAQETP